LTILTGKGVYPNFHISNITDFGEKDKKIKREEKRERRKDKRKSQNF